MTVAASVPNGLQDLCVVGQELRGFAYQHVTGVFQACGALVHGNLVSGLTLGEVSPGRYLVHPSAYRMFSHEEPVEVVLKNSDLTT